MCAKNTYTNQNKLTARNNLLVNTQDIEKKNHLFTISKQVQNNNKFSNSCQLGFINPLSLKNAAMHHQSVQFFPEGDSRLRNLSCFHPLGARNFCFKYLNTSIHYTDYFCFRSKYYFYCAKILRPILGPSGVYYMFMLIFLRSPSAQ